MSATDLIGSDVFNLANSKHFRVIASEVIAYGHCSSPRWASACRWWQHVEL